MIEVKNLVKSYNGNIAVSDLNFTIEKGQIVGFLGPNGAGKSTTMNIITGYISATKGNVTIDGFDILKEPEKAKKNIGYLPEMPPLYMDMTVKEYLKFVAKLKGLKRNEIEDSVEQVMETTKIVEMENRLNKFLSKGFKQRVGLAAALIGNPEVLILDEPSVGLDPMQIIEIRNLIKNLASTHTIILSSHILTEISAVCDRVIIIHHGKVVIDELMQDIDKNIADSECLEVLIKTNKAKIELVSILKKIPKVKKVEMIDYNEKETFCARLYSDGADIREVFFGEMIKNNIIILNMSIERMSLEDIFLEATSEENVYKMIEENEKKQKNIDDDNKVEEKTDEAKAETDEKKTEIDKAKTETDEIETKTDEAKTETVEAKAEADKENNDKVKAETVEEKKDVNKTETSKNTQVNRSNKSNKKGKRRKR